MIPDLSLRSDPSPRTALAVLGALVAVIAAGEVVLTRVVETAVSGGGFPAWFPRVGSIGQTVVFYATVFDALTFVAVPAALLWLGYACGYHRATTEIAGQ
ncbi:hypothetical protein [Halomicrobium salinisoli]|uniref:hypothetical protein n=1 Tax=Halomicrobium salinisoli TaxID=2878391 RepID=UPI001CF089EB|nr:hypothetical protein [Halomicrobium salinisoli]